MTRLPSGLIEPSLAKPQVNASAPGGSAKTAAQTSTPTHTSVQAAGRHPTELKAALEHRRARAITPYNPDAWTSELRNAGIIDRFSTIPDGLRFGFRIDFPNISHVQTPMNAPSIDTYSSEFRDTIQKEITKGRYIGPFPLPLIYDTLGPFQSSPLSLIPKPGCPGKFRLVQNFSFPSIPNSTNTFPSINSAINANNFPTTWGKFSTVYLLAARLPPGSEAATRDVAEAYRTIPLHHSQWPAAVVHTSHEEGCIDTCLAFGVSPSAGVYSHVADAAVEIFRHHGIGPLDKWVDDHIFFRIKREHITDYNEAHSRWHQQISTVGTQRRGGRIWFEGHAAADGSTEEFNEDFLAPIQDWSHISPRSKHDATFSYNIADIDGVSATLGIPWETSKDQPFGSTTTYIGFVWDLQDRTVRLSPGKVVKYLALIKEWQSRATHRLEDIQKLYGKLLHTASLIPAGRAYLTGLEHMLAVCTKKPFMLHRPDKAIHEELMWWHRTIENRAAIHSIFPPPPRTDHHALRWLIASLILTQHRTQPKCIPLSM